MLSLFSDIGCFPATRQSYTVLHSVTQCQFVVETRHIRSPIDKYRLCFQNCAKTEIKNVLPNVKI
jgi:hypothetical protein